MAGTQRWSIADVVAPCSSSSLTSASAPSAASPKASLVLKNSWIRVTWMSTGTKCGPNRNMAFGSTSPGFCARISSARDGFPKAKASALPEGFKARKNAAVASSEYVVGMSLAACTARTIALRASFVS